MGGKTLPLPVHHDAVFLASYFRILQFTKTGLPENITTVQFRETYLQTRGARTW